MKKVLLSTMAVLLIAVSAGAQERFAGKDVFLNAGVSGSSLTYRESNGYSSTDFTVNLTGGYFFSKKFAIDGAVGLNLYKWEGSDLSTTFNVAAGVRFYPVANFYCRVGQQETVKSKSLLSYFSTSVGYDIFVSEKVFFEPSVYFKQGLNENDDSSTLGLSFGVGVRF